MASSADPAYQAALDWINGAASAKDLTAAFYPDPSIRTSPPRSLPFEVAEDILKYRDAQPGGQIEKLEQLFDVDGVDEVMIQDFIYTGSLLVEPDPDPDPDPEPNPDPDPDPDPTPVPAVGVLLPVRLETRFYPPETAGASWRLRLRIVPDRASIDEHDPTVSQAEFDSVVKFWSAAGGDIDSDAGKDAWRTFAGLHGGPRASWLARTFIPDSNGQITPPAQMRQEPTFSRLRGLPATLEVWMARGGNPPQQAATLAVDSGIEQLGLPDLDGGEEHWWHSYAQAEAVGLAAELDLGPATPDDIDALYVVGLSSEDPGGLFAAHRDSGDLALVAPGSPSNTIDGAPAADLAADPELWRRLASGAPGDQTGTDQVSYALTGQSNALGAVPGGSAAPRGVDQELVRALWPAVWGHLFKDILGLGADVAEAGLWAGDNLLPEGPLPALRIGDQPYGLLPATSLNAWSAAEADPFVEEAMRPSLIGLREAWAQLAEAAGNVSGADTARLLDLIGHTASSTGYAYRTFVPLELLYTEYGVYSNTPLGLALLRAWWESLMTTVKSYPVDVQRAYLTYGHPQDIRIPLVEPDNLPDYWTFGSFLAAIADEHPASFLTEAFFQEYLGSEDPNSLLIRLILHALVVAGAEVGRAQAGLTGPVLEPMSSQTFTTRLEQDVQSAVIPPPDPSAPASKILARAQAAVAALANRSIDDLERAFKAVLDTGAYRIDPWISGYAWRRLETLSSQGCPRRLGVYGWVDSPRPGTPGPTEGGLLHAPSAAQAYTAVILRDKAIHDPQADRWQMNLESKSIRIADRLAAEVRLGYHLFEVLGREVERIVGDAGRVDALRAQYPIRAEHAGRRTCNGQAVLEEDPAVLQAPPFSLSPATLDALAALRDALDVYGDLLVAEAVHHVVSGRGAVAGAAMEAAAGLALPPGLDVIRTPRSGRTVGSSLVVCLPPAAEEPPPNVDASTSPTRIADPAVADWIRTQTGDPAEFDDWGWSVEQADEKVEPVTLTDLSLEPSDACVLSMGALRELVLASVNEGVRVLDGGSGDRAHARAREIVGLLGNRPALPEDLVAEDDPTTPDETDVANELRDRLDRLRTAGEALVLELGNAFNSPDDAVKEAALHNAVRWGIVAPADAVQTLNERVRNAETALQARLDEAPDTTAIPDLMAVDLATAIAELAAPDGRYAVLARVDFKDVPTVFGPDALDDEWLSVNAAVRPVLASLESYQLEALVEGATAPLAAWSNRPGDPWQVDEPADPDNGRVPDTHLVAAYGPAGVLDGAPGVLAVGLVDTWSEVVPHADHVTTAAFGFDAPAARAPQAILLAVPPVEGALLDGAALVDIVADTRQLARARMVTPAQLSEFAGAVSTVMVPATGSTAVSLEPHMDIVIE